MQLGGYLYPPPFAQAWVPLSFLPEVVVDWGWRILGVLSVRYMAGSWQVAGLWWLFPGTIVEITAGNVTFQVAALTVAGLRGRAEGILPAAVVKFSTLAVVPFLWLRRPETRRGLLVGGVAAAAIVVVSVLLAPDLWRDWVASIGGQGGFSLRGHRPSSTCCPPLRRTSFFDRDRSGRRRGLGAVRLAAPRVHRRVPADADPLGPALQRALRTAHAGERRLAEAISLVVHADDGVASEAHDRSLSSASLMTHRRDLDLATLMLPVVTLPLLPPPLHPWSRSRQLARSVARRRCDCAGSRTERSRPIAERMGETPRDRICAEGQGGTPSASTT